MDQNYLAMILGKRSVGDALFLNSKSCHFATLQEGICRWPLSSPSSSLPRSSSTSVCFEKHRLREQRSLTPSEKSWENGARWLTLFSLLTFHFTTTTTTADNILKNRKIWAGQLLACPSSFSSPSVESLTKMCSRLDFLKKDVDETLWDTFEWHASKEMSFLYVREIFVQRKPEHTLLLSSAFLVLITPKHTPFHPHVYGSV